VWEGVPLINLGSHIYNASQIERGSGSLQQAAECCC
jgi:hypothetical protein